MRYVIIGAGAIGGVIAARLFQADLNVTVVARGENFTRLSQIGLTITGDDGSTTLPISAHDSPSAVQYRDDDVVIIAVKSQDTLDVIRSLEVSAPSSIAIVCAQNGVENERVALRSFPNVYGMCVMCPATHLSPGEVSVFSSPITGLMDLGRWPKGSDDVAHAIAQDFEASTFRSRADPDVATLKWGKLMGNLGNAVEALCGRSREPREILRRTREEATLVLQKHGIDAAQCQRALGARVSEVNYKPGGGTIRGGGSSWQSLTRQTGSIESDFLNGEIVLLGRLVGVPTPVNELLQQRANALAYAHGAPGSVSEDELLSALS